MSRPEVPTTQSRQFHRRHVVGSVAAAGLGVSVLAACGSDSSEGSDSSGGSGSSDSDSGSSTSGDLNAADVPEGGGIIMEDQETVVTQPAAGEYKAFSSICTHQGCAVSAITDTIDCACHGSKFSLTDGSVVAGPASSPLPEKPISVDGDSLTLG